MKTDVLGVPVSPEGVGDVNDLLARHKPGDTLTITCVNPHACHLIRQHDDYPEMLERFDYVTCDGMGMVLAGRMQGLSQLERQSPDFSSLAGPVLKWAGNNDICVGIVGGQPGVAEKAAKSFRQLVPNLRITSIFSGFGNDPTSARDAFIHGQTGLVLCGMGAPRQERFILDLADNGWAGVGMTCGGFLDQSADGPGYYPAWVDRLHLRFAYRLAREPRRLWRRYLIEYQPFAAGFARLLGRRIYQGVSGSQ
jgi:N-acetylglucosaminyldiphosphoundecaprenol N-acetyl-beta-D-mannosaminyltransferase